MIGDSFGDGSGEKKSVSRRKFSRMSIESKRKLSSMSNEKPTLVVIEPTVTQRISLKTIEASPRTDSPDFVAGKEDSGHGILKNSGPKPTKGIHGNISKSIIGSQRSFNSNKSGLARISGVHTPGFGKSAPGSGQSLSLGLLGNSLAPVNSLAATLLNPVGRMSTRLLKTKEKPKTPSKRK